MYNSYSSTTFGDFGTGKSLYTIDEVVSLYEQDSRTIVISNCWLSIPHIRYNTGKELVEILAFVKYNHLNSTVKMIAPLQYLEEFGIKPSEGKPIPYVLYCDEVSLIFNARDYATNFKDKSILEMLVQPRKYNMKQFFVVQAVDMLDKFIRELTLEIIEVRFYLFGLFRRLYSYDRQEFFNQETFNRATLTVRQTKIKFHFLLLLYKLLIRLPFVGKYFFIAPKYYSQEILGSGSLVPLKTRLIRTAILKRGGLVPPIV